MTTEAVFKQKATEDVPGDSVASSSFPVDVAMDVLLLLEEVKAVTVDNPEAGKIGKDLQKAPAQLRVYEVTFKAVLKQEDLTLVMGMVRDHKVKARLGGGQ